MACKYCVLATQRNVIQKDDLTIDFEFAKKGISDFFRDYSGRAIRYYGAGEPTIEFDLMRRITEYARSISTSKVTFELQTNGFFNEEYSKWIRDNIDFVWISCDGMPDIQDKYRPTINGKSSSKIVANNITFFSNNNIENIGCRATLPLEMIDRQIELIDYFISLGVKYICVERAFSSINQDLFSAEHQSSVYFAEKYYEAYEYANRLGVFYGHLNMANFDEKVRFNCRACFPYPHLTTDGYVSCCDIAPFGKREYIEHTQLELIYGKWKPNEMIIEYDEAAIHRIRSRSVETLRETACKECNIINYCAGGCLGQALMETGLILSKAAWNCSVTKHLYTKMKIDEGLYPVLHS